jgi:hypothetical protein
VLGLTEIKEARGSSSYPRLRMQPSAMGTRDGRSGGMTDPQGAADNPEPQRIPFMQRVLDNPFLLLFLGVTIPTVFYILWGVMELTQVPIAR